MRALGSLNIEHILALRQGSGEVRPTLLSYGSMEFKASALEIDTQMSRHARIWRMVSRLEDSSRGQICVLRPLFDPDGAPAPSDLS